MKTLLFVVALALSMTGCASMGLTTQTQQIEASCSVAATALKALTVANQEGKLSAQQKEQVMKATETVNPICLSPTIPTLDSVKAQAFAQAIAQLQARAAAIGAGP